MLTGIARVLTVLATVVIIATILLLGGMAGLLASAIWLVAGCFFAFYAARSVWHRFSRWLRWSTSEPGTLPKPTGFLWWFFGNLVLWGVAWLCGVMVFISPFWN